MSPVRPSRAQQEPSGKKQDINRLLGEMDFLAALALIRQEVRRGIAGMGLQEEYLSALNGALKQGESELSGNHPEQAGLLFRAVLDNFPEEADLSVKPDLAPFELQAKVDLCADKLLENGIRFYRGGQLEKAIEEWQKILAFHPQHQAGQKAIETANVQLANLRKIETDL